MSAARLLKEARLAGLALRLSPTGKLACRGPVTVLERLKPALAEHRDALLAALRAERDEAVMTVPAGVDPFETARTLINMARAKDAAGELPEGRSYRFRLVDQGAADRRNAAAARAHTTNKFCGCGALARCEWLIDGRPTWICDDCAPTRGRA